MRSVVLDFETTYADGYTLSSMTTEEYVRDPRFETILCGFKVGNEPGYWVDGPQVGEHLRELQLQDCAVVAHHAHFDGLILNHHYGIRPKLWLDTLSMARAVDGSRQRLSLAQCCKRHGLIDKGDMVEKVKGLRRADFSPDLLRRYGDYCVNDCEREYDLLKIYAPHFCRSELELIDSVIRMFTEPVLGLDVAKLEQYVQELRTATTVALLKAGVQLADVRSNDKFAATLRFFGIVPPMKISKTTGKPTYAFAKTDEAMQELAEHPDDDVQALVAARLNAKSTLNMTRALRMIGIAGRGAAPVYIKYYGAGMTGRHSGGDKMNWQNNQRGGVVRDAIHAPDGHVLVVCDSKNIESRTEDWLAMQEDQVEAYRLYDAGLGPDIYCVMAAKIYGRLITEKDKKERFIGKTAKLGLGYGMGAEKFSITAKIPLTQAEEIKAVYRASHHRVVALWKRGQAALEYVLAGVVGVGVDPRGIITTVKDGLLLPNGLVLKYPELRKDPRTGQFSYWDGKARQHIYGGKVIENIVQALARIIVMEQTLMVKAHRLVLSVHDEGVWCVPVKFARACQREVEAAFRTPLWWCKDLPLNCDSGIHRVYGQAKT